MNFYQVPIKAKPSQTLDVILGGQNVTIVLQTRLGKLYASIAINNRPAVRERVCLDRMPIVNEEYRGFVGELFFMDKAGKENPTYDRIGERFVLMYWDGTQ